MRGNTAKWALVLGIAVVVFAGVAFARLRLTQEHLRYRLVALEPDAAAADPALVRFASEEAKPLYAANCAVCHGADMRGRSDIGAPNLTDAVWLYGDGSTYEIERTILYGIRSGASNAHNVTDMPAFGLMGRLSEGQIQAVVQYVRLLSGQSHDSSQASEGRTLFGANCVDCHAFDGRGNSDYGAPDLTLNVWNSGGDPQSLYNSIYSGQHRVMQGWRDTLNLEQIRALAVYLHAVASPPAGSSR